MGDLDRDLDKELRELNESQITGVWTPQKEDRLIDLYKACKFLYDQTHPSFKLHHCKGLAYRRIAQLVGVTG